MQGGSGCHPKGCCVRLWHSTAWSMSALAPPVESEVFKGGNPVPDSHSALPIPHSSFHSSGELQMPRKSLSELQEHLDQGLPAPNGAGQRSETTPASSGGHLSRTTQPSAPGTLRGLGQSRAGGGGPNAHPALRPRLQRAARERCFNWSGWEGGACFNTKPLGKQPRGPPTMHDPSSASLAESKPPAAGASVPQGCHRASPSARSGDPLLGPQQGHRRHPQTRGGGGQKRSRGTRG